jgi:hypothetical protein
MSTTYDYTPAGESAADPELDELYRAITGRKAFSYSAAKDPLYRVAADRAIQNGRLAMRDTMGQAASLTGGYGSSYAQGVGQQRYDEYLRGLADAVPEYYRLAFQQYQAQGDALRDAYGLARQRDQDAYARQQDAAAAARAAEAAAYARQQDAYKQLYNLIVNAGYEPTDEELAAAGMTRAQAEALLRRQQQSAGGRAGSGGGRKKQSGSKPAQSPRPRGGGSGARPGRVEHLN